MLASFLFTDEKILFTVITRQKTQNYRMYAYPSINKKGVVTKRLRTQL